jgi:YegS/Rv2252/BmrU family lipid kinase
MGITSIAMSIDRIVALYAEHDTELEVREIDFDVEPSALLEGLDMSYDYLLVAGGDGTVNYIVNEMLREGLDLPLGVIPSGTANDFASAIGMHSNPIEACRQILECKPLPTDIGEVNGRCFVNVFSFGLFTNVSQHTPTLLKNAIGKAAYVMGGAIDFVKMHPIPIEIHSDDGDWSGDALIVLAFNGKTAGSFPLAKMAEVDDGYLDVLVLKAGVLPALTVGPTFLHYIFKGGGEVPRNVLHFHCSRITINSTRREPTDVDGQHGPELPVEMVCRAGAVRVIRPEK